MVVADRRGRLMSSVMHRLPAGVGVAGRSWRTGFITSSRTSCPSRSRSGGGSRSISASAGGAGVAIRAVTRSRPQMLWGRVHARPARGRVGERAEQGAGALTAEDGRGAGPVGNQVSAGGVVQAMAPRARALEPTCRALIEGVAAARR